MYCNMQEGFAFAHCTECRAVFLLRANVPIDRWWLRFKFQFLVARDHAMIFIVVQLVRNWSILHKDFSHFVWLCFNQAITFKSVIEPETSLQFNIIWQSLLLHYMDMVFIYWTHDKMLHLCNLWFCIANFCKFDSFDYWACWSVVVVC